MLTLLRIFRVPTRRLMENLNLKKYGYRSKMIKQDATIATVHNTTKKRCNDVIFKVSIL